MCIKLAEPKPFNGSTTQAQAWLSDLKCYFIVVRIINLATNAAEIEAVCEYAVVLMGGNAKR